MSGEVWVAIVSVIVTGMTGSLALWLNYRERRAGYRETLYTKQLEIYLDLMSIVERVYDPVAEALERYLIPESYDDKDDKAIPNLLAKAVEEFAELQRKDDTWSAFVPQNLSKKLSSFRFTARKAIYPSDYPHIDMDEVWAELDENYKSIIDEIRDEIGIEPLTEETRDRIGRSNRKLQNHRAAAGRNSQ